MKRRVFLQGGLAAAMGTPLLAALRQDRLDEAAARVGGGSLALRAARRRGLKVHRFGKRGFVAGADLIALITKGGADVG